MQDLQAVAAKLLQQQNKGLIERNDKIEQQHTSYGQELADQVHSNDDIVGVYKGHEIQRIRHTRAESHGMSKQSQIVSNSKIIIPRGIINFKKTNHSVSVERESLLKFNGETQPEKSILEKPTPKFKKVAEQR